jgi:hypothetical protein
MAPEQKAGVETTAASDQYSFCAALEEALCGARGGRDARIGGKRRLPNRLRRVLARGLRRDPAERYPSMTAVVADLDDYLRRTQLRLVAATAAGVAGFFVATTVTLRILFPGPSCDGSVHSKSVWSAERQQRVATAFRDSRLGFADSAYRASARNLESYLGRWNESYRETCEATWVRREQSERALDLRMRCLKKRLGAATALVEVFSSADATVVENAASAIAALPPPSDCDHVSAADGVAPPVSDSMAKTVEALYAQLARTRALRSAGKLSEAKTLATQVHAAALRTTYLPVQAESALALARVHTDQHEANAAVGLYEEAIGAADAAHDDRLRATAAVQLAGALGSSAENVDAALAAGKRARRVIERLGGKVELFNREGPRGGACTRVSLPLTRLRAHDNARDDRETI